MRQHAILSCILLFFGWGVFFGNTLFYMLQPIEGWETKALYSAVLPISFLMMLSHREKLRNIVFKSNLFGFLSLLVLLGIRLYAELLGNHTAQYITVLLMVPAMILASLGLKAFWALCFPSVAVLLAYPCYDSAIHLCEQGMVGFLNTHSSLALAELYQEAGTQGTLLMPIFHLLAYWTILGLFYGYLRYEAITQRLFCYGLLIICFFSVAVIELLSLGWIADWGGVEVLTRFNIQQFNQVSILLSLLLTSYLLTILLPRKPKIRRMMAGNQQFMILVDRHSHWFALTLTTLAMMILSVWLGGNLYQLSVSVIEWWQ